MKRNVLISYVVLAALVVGAAAVAFVLTTGGSSKPKVKTLTVTEKAGVALARDFNRAEKSQGIAISRVVRCEQDKATANRFGCLAVVTNGQKNACGAFVFTVTPAGVVKPENVQAVAEQNCQ